MEKITEQMLLLQIRSLKEQIRILRREKEELMQRTICLEESINKVLENQGMIEYAK